MTGTPQEGRATGGVLQGAYDRNVPVGTCYRGVLLGVFAEEILEGAIVHRFAVS